MKNILIAISGPSGVGKGTIVKKLCSAREDISVSVSCTTRQPRAGEVDKRDYFFIGKEEFLDIVKSDGFLEYDEHFGNLYGTPKKFVEEKLKEKSIILEIDVKGALNAKRIFPETVLIFVAPPSIEELENRLLSRGSECKESIDERIKRVEYELSFRDKYDYVVINDDIEVAVEQIEKIIDAEKIKK